MLLSIFQFDEDSPCWSTTTSCSASRCVRCWLNHQLPQWDFIEAGSLHNGAEGTCNQRSRPFGSAVCSGGPGRCSTSRFKDSRVACSRSSACVQAHPQQRVLVLTGEEDPALLQSAEGSAAQMSALSKSADVKRTAEREVLPGRWPSRCRIAVRRRRCRRPAPSASHDDSFSGRQADVLAAAAAGQVQQADLPRAGAVGVHRQDAPAGGVPQTGREQPHPGGGGCGPTGLVGSLTEPVARFIGPRVAWRQASPSSALQQFLRAEGFVQHEAHPLPASTWRSAGARCRPSPPGPGCLGAMATPVVQGRAARRRRAGGGRRSAGQVRRLSGRLR
jgi:hypothetical protein